MIDEPPCERARAAKAAVAIGIVLAMIVGLTVRSCEDEHVKPPAGTHGSAATPSSGQIRADEAQVAVGAAPRA